jgi:hypothetical protein
MSRAVPTRHWRSYGDAPLPAPAEAMAEPFVAFPSWFLRITCDRCGKDRMLNEARPAQGDARCSTGCGAINLAGQRVRI